MPTVFRISDCDVDDGGCDITTTASLHIVAVHALIEAAIPDASCDRAQRGLAALSSRQRIPITGLAGNVALLRELLDATESCVNVIDKCDVSQCLDFYKVPTESDEEPENWPYTDIGALLYRAKYKGSRGAAVAIASALLNQVRSHPIMRTSTLVAAIPTSGKFPFRPDLPALWAKSLASALGIEAASIRRSKPVSSQKEVRDMSERHGNQANSMTAPVGVRGQRVLLIDDLYMTGETMTEAVRALHEQRAEAVYGLNVVKTVKGSQGYHFA